MNPAHQAEGLALFPTENYAIDSLLATGGFSLVYAGRELATNRQVVIKVPRADVDSQAAFADWDHEVHALIELDGSIVPKLIAAEWNHSASAPLRYRVLDYFDGIDLQSLIDRYGLMSWQQGVALFRQVLSGVESLHAQSVIHGDLAPRNLLVRCDAAGWQVRLIDYGLVRRLNDPHQRHHARNYLTPGFGTPEQYNSPNSIGPWTDVFGLGRTMCYCLFGRTPEDHAAWQQLPLELYCLLKLCLEVEHRLRPSATVFLEQLDQIAKSWTTAKRDRPYQFQFTERFLRHCDAVGLGALSASQRSVFVGDLQVFEQISRTAQLTCEIYPNASPPPGDSNSSMPRIPNTALVGSRQGEESETVGTVRGMDVNTSSEIEAEEIDCTVFAPREIERGQSIVIQAALHKPEEADRALMLAFQADDRAEPRGSTTLQYEIVRGTVLQFEFSAPNLIIDEPVLNLKWRGRPAMVSFAALAPPDCQLDQTIATLRITVNGIPCGQIKLKLKIVPNAGGRTTEYNQHRFIPYRKVFVSYSSKDRDEVLKRVQMLKRLKIECFQDVLDLEPGDRWERELYLHINECDLFLLFWSSAARESEWVRKETAYALQRKSQNEHDLPELIPVIIEGPPIPTPPPELSHLHFNDQILNFLSQ